MMKRQSPAWWQVAITGFIVVFVLGSCGPGSPTQITPGLVTPGQIMGSVVKVSGLEPTPQAVEATVTAASIGGDASQTWSTATGSDGSFAFDLPPGEYEMTGIMTKPHAGDHATPEEVTVIAGQTTHVRLYFIYP